MQFTQRKCTATRTGGASTSLIDQIALVHSDRIVGGIKLHRLIDQMVLVHIAIATTL